MNGVKFLSSIIVSPADSFCQCASRPSPRQETMPIPVMTPSRAASVIGDHVHREAQLARKLEHFTFEFGLGEIDDAERDGGIAGDLAVELALRLRQRES